MKPTLPDCLKRQMTTRLVLAVLVFLGFGQVSGFAQTIFQYTNNSGGVPNYVDPNANNVFPEPSPNLTRGGGVSNMNLGCTGATEGFGATGWPVTNVFDVGVFNAAGDFVEFTLDPDPGFGLKVTGFSTRSRRENVTGTADDGPISIRYGYSVDFGATWTTVYPGNPQSSNLCNSGGVNRVWPAWVTVNTNNPIKFRIYGLSSGSSGKGDLFLRDVIVEGEVCDETPDITLEPIPALCFANNVQSAIMDYADAVIGNKVEVDFVSPNISDLPLTTLMSATGSFSFDVQSGTAPGNYMGTLTVSNSCGFETDYPISVTVNALPNVSVSLSDPVICAGQNVTLTFEDLGATGHTFHLTADLVDDNGTSLGEIDYTGVSDGASIVYTEGVDFDGDENGTVSLVNILVVDEATDCENTLLDLDLTVNPLPDVSITLDDLAICDNGSVTLTFTDLAASGHLFSITADPVDDLGTTVGAINYTNIPSGATDTYTDGIDFEGSMGGTVSLTNILVTDETTGCENTTLLDLNITVNPLPSALLSVVPSGPICPGTAIEIHFEESNWPGGTEFTVGGDASPLVFGLDTLTLYEVIDGDHLDLIEGTDFTGDLKISNIVVKESISGCSSPADSVEVDVHDAPAFEFFAASGVGAGSGNNTSGPNTLDIDFCAGDNLTLTDYGDNGNIGFTVSFTSSGNATYDGGPIPAMSGPTNVAAIDAATFFGSIYGGALGYGLASGTIGTLNQIFVPYLDVDDSGTLTPGDCEGDPMFLNYHIHAIPTVTATPSAAQVCNGSTVNIAFTGNYPANEVTYAWTNDNIAVGLIDELGTGDISFTGTNNTNAPIVANLTVTPFTDYCEGTTVNFTVTIYPEPVVTNITATVNGGSPQSGNNVNGPSTINLDFCAGQSFTYSFYNGTSGIGFIEEITAGTTNLLYGVAPIPVPRPQINIAPGVAAAFFAGTYGPYNLAPGETYGWMSETFTPYFDANLDGDYDAMTDCLGDPITVVYKVYAPIVVNVVRGAGEICSGDPVDYSITTTSSQNITFTLTFGENTNGNNPADLEDDNSFPAPVLVTMNNLSSPYLFNQAVNNALGAFDRGRVTLSISDVHYTDPAAPTCAVTVNNPNPNTQVYPKPILTDPFDVQILAGGTVNLNFDPLVGLPSSNTGTAGFPVRIQWTTTASPGVNVVGPNSGTALIYDQFGALTLGNDISKTINLANNTCNGTVTFIITPESDGPNPGGGFDALFCTGQSFDVVVKVVKPITVEHVYTAGPVTCGEEFTVSVEVQNFCDVSTLDYPFTWDPSVFELVTFSPAAPQALGGGTASVFSNGPGELYFLFADDGVAPFGNDLPNGTVIFTYTLRAIGAAIPPNYNVPNALPLAEAYNSDFLTLPINNLGVSIEIDAISLDLAGNPSVCPSEDFAHLIFTNATGNPNFYVIDFDGCPGFPDIQEGDLDVQDGEILIPLPDNLQSGSCNATLVVSNEYGCVSKEILFSIIIDQVKPTASLLNPTLSQACLPAPAPNAAVEVINRMDNCPGPINAIWVNDTDNGGSGCGLNPKIITRTYQVIDQAGNTSTLSLVQTITIVDNLPPTVSTTGLNAWYSSEGDAIAAAIARANATKMDNCTIPVGINVTLGSITYNGCTASIRLIITDACGNVTAPAGSTYTTIIDTQNPTVTAGTIDDCYDEAEMPSAPYFGNAIAVQAAIDATTASDDCDQSLTITASVSGTDCDLTIVVTATDDCGKSNSVTYHTRVENDAPIISPYDPLALDGDCFETVQDAIDAALAITHAGDDCTPPAELQYDAFVSEGCPAEVLVVVTDFCGNLSMINYTGLHIDSQNPTVDIESYEICFKTLTDAILGLTDAANADDNCTAPEDLVVTHTEVEVAPIGDGCNIYDITLTFTDNCQNSVSATFTNITIDNTQPTITPMTTLEYTCLDDVDVANTSDVVATDNCTAAAQLEVEWISDVLPTSCPGTGTRTYRVTDCAGNSRDVVQIISINDNVKPTWVTTPANELDRSFICGDDISAALVLVPIAEDNCGEVTVTLVSDVTGGGCANMNRTRTWRAFDQCGNSSTNLFTQVITVIDNIAPVWSTVVGSLNRSVECSNTAGLSNAQALAPAATDACTGFTLVKTSGIFQPGGGCPQEGTYTNTWTATDACGNTSTTFTQVITITDDTAPSWVTPQGQPYPNGLNMTISCSDQAAYVFANGLTPIATDLCDVNVTLVKSNGAFVPGGDCIGEGSFTNTWIATDDCSNSSTIFTQTITVVDNTPPTFDPLCQFMPLNLFTGNGADCHAGISLVVGDVLDYQDSWTVAGVPIDPLGSCISDNCSPLPSIRAEVVSIVELTGQTVVVNSEYTAECVRQITISFQLSDDCGNVQPTLFTCIYNIIDNTDPFIFCPSGPDGGPSLPEDCYPSVAAAELAALEAVDPCDYCTAYEDLNINVTTVGTCNAAVTVSVADCAGNEVSYTFYTRIDNDAPVMVVSQIQTCYPNVAAAQAAAIAGTTITDNCNIYEELTITATTSGVCPAVVTVTATDQCGNSRSVSYPGLCIGMASEIVIAPEASNQNVGCSNWQSALAAWLANHGGAAAPGMGNVWTYQPVNPQTILEMSMPNCTTHTKSVVVTFRVTNGCGNFDETTATFSVTDNTPPTANPIPNTTLTCTNVIPVPDVNLVTGEADDCGGTPTVTVGSTSDNQASGCPGSPRIITHQYIVTDGYCNTAAVNHLITIVDNVPPTFTEPANITINVNQNCGYTATTAVTGDVLDEMDNCTPSGPNLQAFYTDVVSNGTGFQNKFVITRTWRLTDACGNTAIPRVQTITVKDVNSPTITGCPTNLNLPGGIIELNCGALYGAHTNPVFNDNCPGAAISYQLSGVSNGMGSGYVPSGTVLNEGVTTVTYTVTDAVGNTANCSFTVTVNCVTISGRLIWEHDKATGVKDGTVSLTPTAPLVTDLSDVMGNYELLAPANGDYTITPVKNINRLNGVNAADATAILNHVNGTALITDPYKKVCADVNRTNVITSQDATIITQSLAGYPPALAVFNVYWRFVDKSFVWPSAGANVIPPFPSNITVNVSGADIVGKDFYGMKIGDVAAAWANPANAPNIAPLVWVLQDQTLVEGSEIELTFAASNFNNLSAYQFALDFDPTQMQFVEFQPLSALQLNLLNNFGAYNADLGELRHVWSAGTGTTLTDGTPVFRAKFKVLKGGQKLSDVLHIDDSQIECKAFSGISAPADVKVAFAESVGTDSPIDPNHLQLQLMQNRPNPFADATTIGFILPEACDAHIRILDISGRELTTYDRKYTSGYHELDFKMENAWTYGVLFCELVTPQGKRVIKMITAK